MVDFNTFSKEEKKEIILDILGNNNNGLTTSKISKELPSQYKNLISMLDELIKEDKIKKMKFGHAYLYKLKEAIRT